MSITAATKVPFRWSSRCISGECSPMQTLSPQDEARPGPMQEKPWNMLSVGVHTTSRVWTVTCPNSIRANWSNSSIEGVLLLVALHATPSSTLSLKIQGKPGACRGCQEDRWEVDQDMQDEGSSLNYFGPKAMLCHSEGPALVQQQPQKTDLQWCLFPVTTGKRCMALCGSLGNELSTVGFLWYHLCVQWCCELGWLLPLKAIYRIHIDILHFFKTCSV